MRKATFAKLSLTAAVGLGTLLGQATLAQAETPPKQLDQTGDIVFVPAPPTTLVLPADEVDPKSCGQIDCIPAEEVDPQPEPECPPHMLCTDEKAPLPGDDPEPECNPIALCDEITSDPGCNWTHGCPEDPEPECNPIALCDEITSDPGCNVTHGDCGGGDEGTDDGDEGTDDGGDETTDGEEGTTGGTTDGGGSGGTLPKTGGELAAWAIAGLGLTGVGAGLRKLSQRGA